MFVGEAKNLPYSGAPEQYFTHVGSGLTQKYKVRFERLAMVKHTNLLRKLVNYRRKKSYNTGPWPYQQTLD
jgi:hypothetical protein